MCRDPSRGFFCYSHGYSTHFFCVASFLWTTTIAFTLHRTVVKHKTDVEDLEAMFHLYVWGMTFLCVARRISHFSSIVIKMLASSSCCEREHSGFGSKIDNFCFHTWVFVFRYAFMLLAIFDVWSWLQCACIFTGTSLVVTVVRSIGNNHSHLGTWCWSQSGRTGKVST